MNAARTITLFAALLVVLPVAFVVAQSNDGIEVVHVRGPIYLLAGAGGNITVSAGPDGVLLVDSGVAQMSDRVIAAIRQLQRQVTTTPAATKRSAEPAERLPAATSEVILPMRRKARSSLPMKTCCAGSPISGRSFRSARCPRRPTLRRCTR